MISMKDSPRTAEVVTTCAQIRAVVTAAQREGKTVGLIPTMGALHAGHLSLASLARSQCDVTVVTIFVNPTQFGPGDDFAEYPRTLEADLAALAPLGVDWVFAPPTEEMYDSRHTTSISVGGVTEPLEGRHRPGHFSGVATIVLKLLGAAPADIAYFGQKDYQQSLLIRRMVADLKVPTEICVCPIVREPDGLAMSSRNVYLSDAERMQALALSRGLSEAHGLFAGGQTSAAAIRSRIREVLASAKIDPIDYVALVDPENLTEVDEVDESTIALIAVHVGKTRLIDNHVLGERWAG